MNYPVFGEMTFNHGYDGKTAIALWGRKYDILCTAAAYYEKDGVTAEQSKTFAAFQSDKAAKLAKTEALLQQYVGGAAVNRLTPRTLIFERDGGCALLLDDSENPDNGLAVLLFPNESVMTQDEYL